MLFHRLLQFGFDNVLNDHVQSQHHVQARPWFHFLLPIDHDFAPTIVSLGHSPASYPAEFGVEPGLHTIPPHQFRHREIVRFPIPLLDVSQNVRGEALAWINALLIIHGIDAFVA